MEVKIKYPIGGEEEVKVETLGQIYKKAMNATGSIEKINEINNTNVLLAYQLMVCNQILQNNNIQK